MPDLFQTSIEEVRASPRRIDPDSGRTFVFDADWRFSFRIRWELEGGELSEFESVSGAWLKGSRAVEG